MIRAFYFGKGSRRLAISQETPEAGRQKRSGMGNGCRDGEVLKRQVPPMAKREYRSIHLTYNASEEVKDPVSLVHLSLDQFDMKVCKCNLGFMSGEQRMQQHYHYRLHL